MKRLFISCLLASLVTVIIFHLMAGMVSTKELNRDLAQHPTAIINKPPTSPIEVETIAVEVCDKTTIKKASTALQQYRACNVSTECVHTSYGFLDGIAINKINRRYTDPIINDLKRICGPRQSHDAFSSEAGVEIRCTEQTRQCDVYQRPADLVSRPRKLDFSK